MFTKLLLVFKFGTFTRHARVYDKYSLTKKHCVLLLQCY